MLPEAEGFPSTGRNCPNVRLDEDVDRLIDVEWDYGMSESFEVNMEISAYDRTGMIADIMAALAEMKISITSINAKVSETKSVTIHLGISIKDLAQFEFVATKIRRLKDVYKVQRFTGRQSVMRAVIQRTIRSSVTSEGTETGRIGAGLTVLLGVRPGR